MGQTDTRTRANFGVRSFRPQNMPRGLSQTASMALEMTLESKIVRSNAKMFARSLEDAIRTALDESDNYKVYNSQVAITKILSNGIPIWSRTSVGNMKRRLQSAQYITAEITFANLNEPNAMPLVRMLEVFSQQLRAPSSPLMHQPVFYGS